MRSPYEKIMQIELLSLGSAILFGLLGLTLTSTALVIMSIYLIALSLACDAFQHMYSTDKQIRLVKQLIRAILIIILSTALLLF